MEAAFIRIFIYGCHHLVLARNCFEHQPPQAYDAAVHRIIRAPARRAICPRYFRVINEIAPSTIRVRTSSMIDFFLHRSAFAGNQICDCWISICAEMSKSILLAEHWVHFYELLRRGYYGKYMSQKRSHWCLPMLRMVVKV